MMGMNGLGFEKPLQEFESKIAELKELASSLHFDLSSEIEALEKQLLKQKKAVYSKLTPWQKMLMQRETPRPRSSD